MSEERKKKPLKVAGWVSMRDNRFGFMDEVTDEAFDAIVEDVRKNGYLFGGNSHQESSGCCPLMSNGLKAAFSWRGWGYLIAVAYDAKREDGTYDHMCGYMDSMIKRNRIKRPEEHFDVTLFDDFEKVEHELYFPKSQGYDTFGKMGDMRVACGVTDKIKPWQFLYLLDDNFIEGTTVCCYYLIEHVERGKNFEELLQYMKENEYHSDVSEDLGYGKNLTDEQLLAALYEDYPREEVEKHGAVYLTLSYAKLDWEEV